MSNIVEYKDQYNRFHIKKVSKSDPYPTNNAYIYSFYAAMVGLYNENDDWPTLPRFKDIYPGFHRHPDQQSVAISHDEYIGVAGLSFMRARKICVEGKENHWQFCDLPGFESKPFWKLNPFKVIRDFWKLSREKDEQGKNNSRKATIKYPYIWPMCFWHRPNVQYFYRRCCNKRPGLHMGLAFLISSLFTIYSKNRKVMLGFKLVRLNKDEANLLERFVTYVYRKKVDFIKEVDDYIDDKECPILLRVKARHENLSCII